MRDAAGTSLMTRWALTCRNSSPRYSPIPTCRSTSPSSANGADRASQAGLSVVLVEAELVGGECSYWACMPSKTLLRPGATLNAARRVPGVREAVTGTIDTAKVLAWRTYMTSDWHDDGQVSWLESAGIALVRGRGRLAGERTVDVDGRRLTARRAVVIATGSVPV